MFSEQFESFLVIYFWPSDALWSIIFCNWNIFSMILAHLIFQNQRASLETDGKCDKQLKGSLEIKWIRSGWYSDILCWTPFFISFALRLCAGNSKAEMCGFCGGWELRRGGNRRRDLYLRNSSSAVKGRNKNPPWLGYWVIPHYYTFLSSSSKILTTAAGVLALCFCVLLSSVFFLYLQLPSYAFNGDNLLE